MARTLANSKLNPKSNKDYVEDVDGLDSDASGAAAARTTAVAKASEAALTEPNFDLRQAAKKALSNSLK
jgi:hypothetical protein